jgi:HK97 family phage prohead protease
MEHKQVAFAANDIDLDEGTFSGHASIFNIPDDGDPPDIILPGAFAKTITEWGPTGANRIKILALHRSDWLPIGVPTVLKEDAKGLVFEGKISDTSLGRDILTLMRDRVLTEMSIGFDVIKQETNKARGLRLLHEVRLWEISPVTWAMHPLAAIDDVKTMRCMSERDLYQLSDPSALTGAQPGSPTESAAAAAFAYDPETIQSLKALTADILSVAAEVKAATTIRRN